MVKLKNLAEAYIKNNPEEDLKSALNVYLPKVWEPKPDMPNVKQQKDLVKEFVKKIKLIDKDEYNRTTFEITFKNGKKIEANSQNNLGSWEFKYKGKYVSSRADKSKQIERFFEDVLNK